MGKKREKDVEQLFAPHLQVGEEFRWISEAARNFSNPILNFPVNFVVVIIRIMLLIALLCLLELNVGLIMVLILDLRGISPLPHLWNIFVGLAAVLSLILSMYIIKRVENRMKVGMPKIRSHLNKILFPMFGSYHYYAITNQRIMISEGSNIHDYSLILMADAVIGKPKNDVSTIHIYNSTNPTGQLPEPAFELKGIAEEEAQAAYEILRQAREEALENRAREMGIE